MAGARRRQVGSDIARTGLLTLRRSLAARGNPGAARRGTLEPGARQGACDIRSRGAALGRFRESAFYSSLALELKVGDELNLDDLVEHLRSVGYESGEPVAAVGQFSVRGGIVDVFPPEAEWPFRLEFFGDQLDSVREFDPSSQRSRKPAPHALLLPVEVQRSPQFF